MLLVFCNLDIHFDIPYLFDCEARNCILLFDSDLSVGPIYPDLYKTFRAASYVESAVTKAFLSGGNFAECTYELNVQKLRAVENAAQTGEAIVLFHNHTPASLSTFFALVNHLREMTDELYEGLHLERFTAKHFSAKKAPLSVEELAEALSPWYRPLRRLTSLKVAQTYYALADKSMLRFSYGVETLISSVPEHYDPFIQGLIKKANGRTLASICEEIRSTGLGLQTTFVAYRLRVLQSAGMVVSVDNARFVQLTPLKERFYLVENTAADIISDQRIAGLAERLVNPMPDIHDDDWWWEEIESLPPCSRSAQILFQALQEEIVPCEGWAHLVLKFYPFLTKDMRDTAYEKLAE